MLILAPSSDIYPFISINVYGAGHNKITPLLQVLSISREYLYPVILPVNHEDPVISVNSYIMGDIKLTLPSTGTTP